MLLQDKELVLQLLAEGHWKDECETLGWELFLHYKENENMATGLKDYKDILSAEINICEAGLKHMILGGWEENPEQTKDWVLESENMYGVGPGLYHLGSNIDSFSAENSPLIHDILQTPKVETFSKGSFGTAIGGKALETGNVEQCLSFLKELPTDEYYGRFILSAIKGHFEMDATLPPEIQKQWSEFVQDYYPTIDFN